MPSAHTRSPPSPTYRGDAPITPSTHNTVSSAAETYIPAAISYFTFGAAHNHSHSHNNFFSTTPTAELLGFQTTAHDNLAADGAHLRSTTAANSPFFTENNRPLQHGENLWDHVVVLPQRRSAILGGWVAGEGLRDQVMVGWGGEVDGVGVGEVVVRGGQYMGKGNGKWDGKGKLVGKQDGKRYARGVHMDKNKKLGRRARAGYTITHPAREQESASEEHGAVAEPSSWGGTSGVGKGKGFMFNPQASDFEPPVDC